MTGLVRKASLLCVGALLLAGAAMAGTPNAGNSTISGVPMSSGGGCITISDYPSTASCIPLVILDNNSQAVQFASIVIDFSTCPGDLKVCTTQNDQATTLNGARTQAATAICGTKTVTVSCDAAGQVCLILNGTTTFGSFGYTPAGSLPVCAKIYAESQLMTTVKVVPSKYDTNLSGSVSGGDLSYWLANFLPAAYRSFGDYNCTGTVTGGDLSQWLAGFGQYNANVGLFGCTTYCP